MDVLPRPGITHLRRSGLSTRTPHRPDEGRWNLLANLFFLASTFRLGMDEGRWMSPSPFPLSLPSPSPCRRPTECRRLAGGGDLGWGMDRLGFGERGFGGEDLRRGFGQEYEGVCAVRVMFTKIPSTRMGRSSDLFGQNRHFTKNWVAGGVGCGAQRIFGRDCGCSSQFCPQCPIYFTKKLS